MTDKPTTDKQYENQGASKTGMPYADTTTTHGGRASPDATGDERKEAQENGKKEKP